MTTTRSLTEAERAAMRALMDRLVPPVDDLAGAGTMGLLADVETMAARHQPFHHALLRMLGEVSAEAFPAQAGSAQDMAAQGLAAQGLAAQDLAIRAFEQAEPAVFKTVLDVVYLAYYGDERVHRRIGWRTGPVQPRGFTLPPFDEAILEKARQRAPFWRRA
jgi:hypothetical protein